MTEQMPDKVIYECTTRSTRADGGTNRLARHARLGERAGRCSSNPQV
jgi:hypothetical protein